MEKRRGLDRGSKVAEHVLPPDGMELLWFMLGTLAVAAAVAGALCLLGTPSASASASALATASVRTGAGGGKPGNGRSYPRARAATVPVRCDPGGRLAVLLVRSRNHPESFIFPGGGIEPGESEQEAARRGADGGTAEI